MRISDWSSDVCSSDLDVTRGAGDGRAVRLPVCRAHVEVEGALNGDWDQVAVAIFAHYIATVWLVTPGELIRSEERRVGKECVRRVDLGGRRILKQKKKNEKHQN